MLKKLTFQRWLMALTIGAFLFSAASVSAQKGNKIPAAPGIELINPNLNLGSRPIDAWKKADKFEVVNNPGMGDITITASEIDDATGFFELENPTLPYVLEEGETLEIGLSTPGTASNGDMFSGNYALIYKDETRTLVAGSYTATAYTPVTGNVWETPVVLTNITSTYYSGIFSSAPLYNVYELPGAGTDGKNFVYQITIPNDRLIDINPQTTVNPKWAIYAPGFDGVGGPDVDNALLSGTSTVVDYPLYAGTYYVVFSTTDAFFDISIDVSNAMPLPVAASNPVPVDGAIAINNGMSLTWDLGAYTDEYRLILGTTYPPSTVAVDWTNNLMESYVLAGLQPNMQYFWRVDARNTNGTTTGDVWGFTTSIDVPTGLVANVIDLSPTAPTVAVNLSWDDNANRAFIGYNVYQDGVKLNATPITATSYSVTGLARNASIDFSVTSVFDEGESDPATVTITTKGVGIVTGTVTDQLTTTVIAGATVLVQGTAGTYTLTTAANGTYNTQVYAGSYNYTVSADGYQNATATAVAVAHAATVTTNFQLLEIAFPVDFVIATEQSDDQVLLQWGFDAGRELVEYQIWRERAYRPETAELIGTTEQTQFVDFDWDLQDWGVYQWNVVVVYTSQNSVPVSSNKLDKDMETVVDVTAALNSNDAPTGVKVEFTNISEPALALTYTQLLDATGTFTWDAFRKGTYDIEVSRPGYATINETAVNIFDETSFEWLLIEMLEAPADLYVTPTGLATWDGVVAADRSFVNYKVFNDGVLVASVTSPMYQFGTNGEALVDGETYLAEVAAVFSTGQSAKASYTWTYIACDNYPAPTNFTAEQVEGTIDVAMAWTVPTIPVGDDQIDFARITRNGEVIAEVDAASYLDEDLAFGNQTYCITFVYESGAETCPATLCQTVDVIGGGFVNGNVKEAAYLGGANIEGAVVTLTDVDDDANVFSFTTNAAGNYTGEVLAGTYNYAVVAEGYVTQTLSNVAIAQTATVTHDFVMMEFPYAVGDVVATELSDNVVQVDWSGNTGGGGGGGTTAEWLFYDDGVNVDGIGGPATFTWAIKFDPAQLADYAGTSLTKISIYNRTADVNTLRICEGPNGATQIYEQALTGLPIENWGEVTLNTPVAIDVTKELWITVYTSAGAVYPAGCGAGQNQPNGDLITLDGVTWDHMADLGLPYTWNLRGFVTDMVTNRTTELARTENTSVYESTPVNSTFAASGVKNTSSNANINANANSRELLGFNVYRTTCATGDLQFLGYTLDSLFTDNTWGTAEAGVYKWGVEAVYEQNASVVAFSNCLDKDMVTQVSVTVITNSADSPEGTEVTFTNTSEPDMALVYAVELDETGYYAWDEFRKGTYDITVEKTGFAPISLTDVVIDGVENFEWVLEELLLPVSDLYVNPTGYATWGDGGVIPFEVFSENFDAGTPDTWTIVDGGSNSFTWGNIASYNGNSIDGTPFMFASSDAAGSGSTMNEQLVSPVINAENAEELYLKFDYVYQYIGSEHFSADVYNGTDWVEVFYKAADSGPYPWGPTVSESIDVTEYANPMFQVRFNYVSNGWNWYVALDNVSVTNNVDVNTRELQNYKVWLDGIFITDTENTFYQYDTDGLVEGQEYLSEVAAVYSTGMSAKMSYVWTYHSCETFAGPVVVEGEVIDESDVLISWTDTEPLELVQITQNPGAPANAYYEQFGYGYGVAYDMSAYPDAMLNSINFQHSSWGLNGTWTYKIHVYNWNTKTLIETFGPFSTTGNDVWENGIDLQNVNLGGATTVAILLEPTGNTAADAYPNLSSDNAASPQGSIFGPLSDVNAIGASGIGNFLMEAYIYTAYGAVRATPVTFELVQAPAANSRIASKNAGLTSVIIKQDASRAVLDAFVGANVYRDGVLIAEALTDTSYLDVAVEPGVYTYCVTYVYESGAESCLGANCVEVSLTEDCIAPVNLTATGVEQNNEVTLEWNQDNFQATYLSYGDLIYADAIGVGGDPLTAAVQFDADMLAQYDGRVFSKIKMYYGTGPIGSVTIQIWEGTTLVREQAISSSTITGEAWNEFTFAQPVLIDGTKSYKVGYTVTDYTADGYPGGAQNYMGNPNSDVIYYNGAWDHLNNYLPYSWLIEAYVSAADMATATDYVAITSNVISTSTNSTLVSAPSVNLNRGNEGRGTREFLGYNIYKNGVLFVENHPETTYTYLEGAAGSTCYTVTAVYSLCGESEASNEACVDFITGIETNELSNVKVYPNPSNSVVNIDLTSNISRVIVYNFVGQVVFEQNNTKTETIQLNVNSYEVGAYLVKFVTNAGESFTKKVVITK